MYKINKNYDLLYYHNKIIGYIKSEKESISYYESACQYLIQECYHSLDIYGILDKDREFVESLVDHSYPPPKKTKKLTYRQFKDNIKEVLAINKHITFIKTQDMVYPVNVSCIIDKYKNTIQSPIKMSFIGRKKTEMNDDLQCIFDEFFDMIKCIFSEAILNIIFEDTIKNGDHSKHSGQSLAQSVCENCKEIIHDSTCYNCGSIENEVVDYDNSTYDDNERININKQFTYEKKCHFRDTINQYQGKQNKYIPDDVYKRLNEYIEKEGLFDKKATTKLGQYSKVKKSHIKEFLKATGYSSHYEDLQLIYSKITGKECPSISQYEKKLYEDFDNLVNAFLTLSDIKRDNFLNSHYVLRQLLLNQGVKLPAEELNYLKTPSRLRSHDEIYKKCCEKLNWNFTPMA